MEQTADIRITGIRKLVSPNQLKQQLPLTEASASLVAQSRRVIQAILDGQDPRLLAIVGPCSIHDPRSALDFAGRLQNFIPKISDRLYVVMRVYFEKPRTSLGWRGLILDPDINGTYNIEKGLSLARGLLLNITQMNIPTATEVLDPIVPQYIADLVSWAAVGARTTESQTHREMASGLSMPVGFKNSTDGSLDNAVHAIISAAQQRSFIGIDQDGETAVLTTTGNPWGHLILRGGKDGPNYGEDHILQAAERLRAHQLRPRLIVDTSHANSGKDPTRQLFVLDQLVQSFRKNLPICGFMMESNLLGGRQEPAPLETLQYGVSITDACLGWEATEAALLEAHRKLKTD